jgi:hypothetical protein
MRSRNNQKTGRFLARSGSETPEKLGSGVCFEVLFQNKHIESMRIHGDARASLVRDFARKTVAGPVE